MMPEFWAYKIDRTAKYTFTDIKDCFIDNSLIKDFRVPIQIKKEANRGKGYNRKQHKRTMDKLSAVHKGLDSYKKPDIKLYEDDIELERTKGRQGGFVANLILLLILFLTMILLIVRRDVTSDYWIKYGLDSDLLNDNSDYSFNSIENFQDIQNYIINSFGPAMYPISANSNSSTITRRLYPAGKIRFRQVRSKVTACPKASAYKLNLICYEYIYNDRTKQTTNLSSNNSTSSYLIYQESTSANSIYEGVFGSYGSSGYYIDFDTNITLFDFIAQYNQTIANGWLDNGTRALFITGNFYIPNKKQFVSILIVIENDVMGQCYPSTLDSRLIVPNFYTGNSLDSGMLAIEIVRFILGFYLLYLYVLDGLTKNSKGEFQIKRWFSLANVFNLFIFVIIIVAFAYSFYVNCDIASVFNTNYKDLGDLYYYYTTCIVINNWILLLVFFRWLSILKCFTCFSVYFYTLRLSAFNTIYFIIILLPILVVFCVLTVEIYGPYLLYYRNMKVVIISNLLFSMGIQDINQYLDVSDAWTIGIVLIFFFGVFFFLFHAFFAIILDSYRIAEIRYESLVETMEKNEEYKPVKIWFFNAFSACKKKKD